MLNKKKQIVTGLCKIIISLLLIQVASSGCGYGEIKSTTPKPSSATHSTTASSAVTTLTTTRISKSLYFSDQRANSGIEFVYDTGARGKALMVESTGGGCGWGDFDRDGLIDLYLVQGGDCLASIVHVNGDRLFHNQSPSKFNDATASARIIDNHYGQGVAIGDYDNDGFDDIFVTNVGPDMMLHNLGDGTFIDVTDTTGTGDPRWGSSAAWADIDLDGDLDLFVCNYLKYDIFNPVACRTPEGTPATCHPEELDAEDNECFENLGNGQFQPIAQRSHLLAPGSKSLGLAIADFNLDGRIDVYIANDTTANHFFERESDGKYSERAVELGCAMNILGQYQASMGVAVGDYDRNGFLDIYTTHFLNDSNTLYRNLGAGGFHDVTRAVGLHKPTLPVLGFGTIMADFNADGQEDIFVTNGDIDDTRSRKTPKEMMPQLFTCEGNSWRDVSAESGEFFSKRYIGRGAASADYDNDGDLDLAVVHQGSQIGILRNDSHRGVWLEIELIGVATNRRGIGAVIEIVNGSQKHVRHLVAGTSYCASHQPLVYFGLGEQIADCEVRVRWPSDEWISQTFHLKCNQRHILIQSVSASEPQ